MQPTNRQRWTLESLKIQLSFNEFSAKIPEDLPASRGYENGPALDICDTLILYRKGGAC